MQEVAPIVVITILLLKLIYHQMIGLKYEVSIFR